MTKPKILIVDDEKRFSDALKLNIEAASGYEVSVCNQSTEALTQVGAFMPDVILLDIMMPGLTGTEIAERLKEKPETASIPIIFITGLLTPEKKSAIGARYLLPKPVETQAVVETIRTVLTDAA